MDTVDTREEEEGATSRLGVLACVFFFFFGLFFELPKALVWYAESCADLEEFLKKRSSSSNKSKAE